MASMDTPSSHLESSSDLACTLWQLPSEVRAAIYKIVFSGQPRSITYPYNHPFDLVDKRHWGLLLVSKSIYAEAVVEYYRTCIFGLYTLNAPHLRKLIQDMKGTLFATHAANFLVWKVPDPDMFEALRKIKWVKLLGVTCGVEPDDSVGQLFTYNSVMMALRRSRVPGFSWTRFENLFKRYDQIDFMLDLRCDYWETKLAADGQSHRRWVKTNFEYDVRADTFVQETRGANKSDRLVLRPPGDFHLH